MVEGRTCEVADEHAVVRAAVQALDEAFAVYRAERDADGAVVGLYLEVMNPTGLRWLGVDPGRIRGADWRTFAPEPLRAPIWDLLAGAAGGSQARTGRIAFGEGPAQRTREVRAVPFDDDRVVLTCQDITERVAGERSQAQAYQEAASARATLQTALDSTSDAFAVYDVLRGADGLIDRLRLVMINVAGAAPLGAAPADLAGWDLREVDPTAQESGLWEAIGEALNAGATRTVRVHRHDAEGHWVASCDTTIAPVGSERVVLTWRDVTEEERRGRDLVRAHDQAWYAATHDPLTGLANRALLVEQLHEALWSADPDHRVAVVYVDLDRFKQVNDSLGHAAGDDLLRAMGDRLVAVIRTCDLAARIGGDEFVLVLRNVRREWDAPSFLQRVREAMEQPLTLGEAVVRPRASFGVVVSPPAPADIDALLREADGLMYRDKLAHR